MSDRPLPPETVRALDAAAAVVGQRTATTAHPDCLCVTVTENGVGVVYPENRRKCPLHRPEPKP